MSDPEITPEQQARLRRLLADARHGEPIPVDVAARLDRVLEQLGAQDDDPPVPVHSGRRRWIGRGLLAAAAAVVVAGIGVGIARHPAGGSADSSAASADSTGATGDAAAPKAEAGGAADRLRTSAAGRGASSSESRAQGTGQGLLSAPSAASVLRRIHDRGNPVPLTHTGFARQVRGAQETARPAADRGDPWVCEPAAWGRGRLVAAAYGGSPAVLVYRPVRGDTQVVDLLRCGTAEVVRSATLPRH